MNKYLRYSLTLVFALVASVGFAQTTFDFDKDYKTLFPNLPGVSSSTGSNDGDFNEATTLHTPKLLYNSRLQCICEE